MRHMCFLPNRHHFDENEVVDEEDDDEHDVDEDISIDTERSVNQACSSLSVGSPKKPNLVSSSVVTPIQEQNRRVQQNRNNQQYQYNQLRNYNPNLGLSSPDFVPSSVTPIQVPEQNQLLQQNLNKQRCISDNTYSPNFVPSSLVTPQLHQPNQNNHHYQYARQLRCLYDPNVEQQQIQMEQQVAHHLPRTAVTCVPILNEQEQMFLFIKILLRCLEQTHLKLQKQSNEVASRMEALMQRVKTIIRECTRRNRANDPEFVPLSDVIERRLVPIIPQRIWHLSQQLLYQSMNKQNNLVQQHQHAI